ncbi:MAG: ATP-binding cassette domain-containing protein [Pseudohongiellaceae bacterium]
MSKILIADAGGTPSEGVINSFLRGRKQETVIGMWSEPADLLRLKWELRLDNIHYRYPKTEQDGLSGVSLSIRAGEKIGVVGSTGAGKTTLADLVLGLLRPQQGCTLVDDREVTEGCIRAWQQTVGYVPQDIFLTDASIAENIALRVPPDEIDREQVRRAATVAQIDGFVMRELAQGYDTLIGERGVRLSGGQRQRIGIARALYHEADLIVFDEATSALDNLTEREVMAAGKPCPATRRLSWWRTGSAP